MKAMLHGVRRIDMVGRDDGVPVKGFSLFISYPSEGVQGCETSKLFVSDAMVASSSWSPEVGKLVMIDFTPKGKISAISTVHEK